jgi:hypothetical protein
MGKYLCLIDALGHFLTHTLQHPRRSEEALGGGVSGIGKSQGCTSFRPLNTKHFFRGIDLDFVRGARLR